MNTFVPGGLVTLTGPLAPYFLASPSTMLLPYFEGGATAAMYQNSVTWYQQSQIVANQTINTFVCPSDDKDNPVYHPALDIGIQTVSPTFPVPSPTGVPGGLASAGSMRYFNGFFGALDYSLCSGISDSLCVDGQVVPGWERGMFAFNMANTAQAITDGLSNTFMMGEGRSGLEVADEHRPLLGAAGGLSVYKDTNGQTAPPLWAWIAGEVNTRGFRPWRARLRFMPAGPLAARSIR